MNYLLIGVILALIPFVNFALKYYFSSKEGNLKLFKSHWTTYYLDWLFVPFNFFWIWTFNLELRYLLFFLVLSFILFIGLKISWINQHRMERRPVYLFDIRKSKIKNAGYVELIFFIIEGALLGGFLFSNIISKIVYLEMGILILFLFGIIPSSKKIHGKIFLLDKISVLIGVICLAIKILI